MTANPTITQSASAASVTGLHEACSAVFYFVLLLPQFGFASADTHDFAPNAGIANNHRIESGIREAQ